MAPYSSHTSTRSSWSSKLPSRHVDVILVQNSRTACTMEGAWIVDLVERCALVYRIGQLEARHPRGTGTVLVAEFIPEVSVELDEVFQAARLPDA
jgi:hypothetical protein